jgi:hypothetical protein
MVGLNKYAKNNATIADLLNQYRECKSSCNSFVFLDLVLDIAPIIADEVIKSIYQSDYLQLLKYTSMVANMYMTTDTKYNSKRDCFYYNLYSNMYSLLLLIINENYWVYGSPLTTATVAVASEDTATATVAVASEDTSNTATVAVADTYEVSLCDQYDDDDDDLIVHLYFDALCNCMECTNNRNEQPATATVAADYNTPTTTATTDNMKGSAMATTTATTATATTATMQHLPTTAIYDTNGKWYNAIDRVWLPLTMEVATSNTATTATVAVSADNTATVAVADYNLPATTATATATVAVADYYEKYKINTATRRQQKTDCNNEQRQQRQRLQYKNMQVKKVYEKMTATRRYEKLNNAMECDYKIDLLEYYNDGNDTSNGNHGNGCRCSLYGGQRATRATATIQQYIMTTTATIHYDNHT